MDFFARPGEIYYLEVADYGFQGGGNLVLNLSAVATETIDAPLDIILLQDETGSMMDDISALQALAPQIWDSIAAISTAQFTMGVAGFRDYARDPWGMSNDFVYRLLGDTTINRDAFVSGVSLLTASGGNDIPESQYAALYYLLNTSHSCIDSNGNGSCNDYFDTPAGTQPGFRSGANRVILLATDAPFHDPEDTGGYPWPNRDQVVSALAATRSIVIGLVPGGAGFIPEVDELAALTGGSTQATGATGEQVAQAILDALKQVQPVSPDLSLLVATPSTVSVDGSSQSELLVTLVDTVGKPVQGRTVRLYSDRGADVITQPVQPTDQNGQARGSILSLAPGASQVWAVDVTDNVQLAQRAEIQFTQPTITPNQRLKNCIDMLERQTNRQFNYLADLAVQAAGDAGYFEALIGPERAKFYLDLLWGFVNVGYPAAYEPFGKAMKSMGYQIPGSLNRDWGAVRLLKTRFPNAGNLYDLPAWEVVHDAAYRYMPPRAINNGLLYFGAELSNSLIEETSVHAANVTWETFYQNGDWSHLTEPYITESEWHKATISGLHDEAASGVPVMDEARMEAYAEDLCYRALAVSTIGSATAKQADFAHNLRSAHDGLTAPDGLGWFLFKFFASQTSYLLWDGAGKLLFDGVTSAFETYIDAKKLEASEKGFGAAQSFFNGLPQGTMQIYNNSYKGYERLMLNADPARVQGDIVNIRQVSERTGLLEMFEKNSYLEVEVKNPMSIPADYQVQVDYGYNSRLLGLPWVNNPVVLQQPLSLRPGETGTVKIWLKQDEKGGSPDKDSYISTTLIGFNGNGNYQSDYYSAPWQPATVDAEGGGALLAIAEETPAVEYPLAAYLTVDEQTGLYQNEIWLANPFTGTITAHLTQPLPEGLELVSTDGILSGNTITWQRDILASDISKAQFTFRFSQKPGEMVVLPGATLNFVEPASGQGVILEGNAPAVLTPWPVKVAADTPVGKYRQAADLPVRVSNLVPEAKNVKLEVKLVSGEKTFFQETQEIQLAALEAMELNFILPGNLLPGGYLLTIDLEVDGAQSQLFYDVYSVAGDNIFLPNLVR